MLSAYVHITVILGREKHWTISALVAAGQVERFYMVGHSVAPVGGLATDETLVLYQTSTIVNLLYTLTQPGQVA